MSAVASVASEQEQQGKQKKSLSVSGSVAATCDSFMPATLIVPLWHFPSSHFARDFLRLLLYNSCLIRWPESALQASQTAA